MKKTSLFLIIAGLVFVGAAPASAQVSVRDKINLSKPVAAGSEGANLTPKKEIIINSRIDNLKKRAIIEIDRRITSLTKVSKRISDIKRLAEAQKTSLINNIQAEIASLTALKSKIQADTDAETLRTDTKSIVTSYRIYLLYLPSTQIIITADALLNTADKMSQLADKLQSRITEEKNKGTDTSIMETTLADMKSKIADAKIQANKAIETVTQLQPTDFPGNKPVLQSAREILATAHKDIITAMQDSQKILVELRKLNKTPELKAGKASESAAKVPASTSNTQPAE